jgi:hypothetical protein
MIDLHTVDSPEERELLAALGSAVPRNLYS